MIRAVEENNVSIVGVDDSSTYRLGSSVGERPSRIRDVPGSIPGLVLSFLFLQA